MYPEQRTSHGESWSGQALRLLRRYLMPHWPMAAAIAALIALQAWLQLLGPQVMQRAIDAVTAGTTATHLAGLAGLYALAAVSTRATQAATSYATADLGWRATNRLRADLARHVLDLPLHFHGEHTPGQLAERIDGDVGALFDFLSGFLLQLLANACLVVGAVVVLFHKDWRVGVVFLVALAGTAVAYRKVANVAVGAAREERQAQSDLMGVIEEALSGAEDARPLGAEPYLLQRFYRAARAQVRACAASWPRSGIPWAVTAVVMGLNEAIGLAAGTRLVEANVLTIGAVYLIADYSDMIASPLRVMARQMGHLQAAGASVLRVTDLLGRERERSASIDERTLPTGRLGVRFDHVGLAYGNGTPVLKDVSFTLSPGASLGVVGRTGGGKSSLVRLPVRLYEPTEGAVLLGEGDDWRDVRDVPLDHLRRRVALVTQEVQLFAATVRGNLTLFGSLAGHDEARLVSVLEDVGLGEWLRGLPAGLDTMLRPGESGLSAGQGQLLALARVFLRDPGLVLLDEASSRLDPLSEALLERAIDRLLVGRTAIIVAHRLQTLQRVDQVLVIEDGEVREMGSRQSLAADPASRFQALLRAADHLRPDEE